MGAIGGKKSNPADLTGKPATNWASGAAAHGGAGQGPAAGGLPAPVQAKFEELLGADFSDVRVMPNSCVPAEVGARAFTSGSTIHFAPGAYHPQSASGQKLLGHELNHVMQQRQGRLNVADGGGGS